MPRVPKGMTLTEMLVVLILVGIIAAVALPSYQASLLKSRRNQAQMALLALHSTQQQYRLRHHQYAGAGQLAMPKSAYYQFSIANASAGTFTLVAKATSQQPDKICPTMTLTSSLQKSPPACWLGY